MIHAANVSTLICDSGLTLTLDSHYGDKGKVSDINSGNGWRGDTREQQKRNKPRHNIHTAYDGGKDTQRHGNLPFGKEGKQCGNHQRATEHIARVTGDAGENQQQRRRQNRTEYRHRTQ